MTALVVVIECVARMKEVWVDVACTRFGEARCRLGGYEAYPQRGRARKDYTEVATAMV